jgi:hypothetical protein
LPPDGFEYEVVGGVVSSRFIAAVKRHACESTGHPTGYLITLAYFEFWNFGCNAERRMKNGFGREKWYYTDGMGGKHKRPRRNEVI